MPTSLPRPPAEIAWLADAIGAASALALIEAHGGTVLYVPHHPEEGSTVALAIGLDAARLLAQKWGGNKLKIPLAKLWRVQIMKAERKSYAEIARALGTTESSVWRMLDGLRLTQKQLSLFD